MSETLHESDAMTVSSYAGPRCPDGSDPRRIQLTLPYGSTYTQLDRAEVWTLTKTLLAWLLKTSGQAVPEPKDPRDIVVVIRPWDYRSADVLAAYTDPKKACAHRDRVDATSESTILAVRVRVDEQA